MASSFVQYLGDGANRLFQVPFEYLDKGHVAATVNGSAAALAWEGDQSVRLATAPAKDAVVEVLRKTPSDTRLVDFVDGSVLTESDLDLSALQLLFVAQEAADRAARALGLTSAGVFSARGLEIIDVADPKAPQSAATKKWTEANLAVERTRTDATINSRIDEVASKIVFVFVEKEEGVSIETRPYYIHTQPAASYVWTVDHNLNSYPKPTIYDDTGAFVVAEYTFNTLNQMRIIFSAPTAGVAYIS